VLPIFVKFSDDDADAVAEARYTRPPKPPPDIHDGGEPVVAPRTWPVVPAANSDGMPAAEVISTPLLAVVISLTVLVALEYRIWFAVVVEGYVAVENTGSALEPALCST
jgi:hypothetical protein